MAAYYDELFKTCGWEIDEIEQERPRIGKALQKLRINAADAERAREWVGRQHDLSLRGIRLLLRAWLMETVDMVLAKDEGKKLIYYAFPAIAGPVFLVAASAPNLYVGCPDMVLASVMGHIFNRLDPLLETGEENGIPPGHGLCSLWQIKVGMLTREIMPPPDLGIAGGYFCDMGCKADGYLEWKYGIPVVYVDGSMDSPWGEFPDFSPERVQYLGAQLDGIFEKVKEVAGVEVRFDPDTMAKANFFREFFTRLTQLNQLIVEADPVPVSTADTFLSLMLGGACTGRGIQEGYRALEVLTRETKERIDQGIGVVEKGAPRVLLLIGSVADARVVRMIEETGLAVPTTLFNQFPMDLVPQTPCTTFGEMIADMELQIGLYHSTFAMARQSEWTVQRLKVDGYIFNYQFNCRPAALFSHDMRKWVEESTGVPTLSLENDIYDPRNYSAAAMRTRVETFAQILKARKACGG